VLLEAFLERHRAELEEGAFPQFEELLEAEDDQLWDWLQGSIAHLPERFSTLICALRRGT